MPIELGLQPRTAISIDNRRFAYNRTIESTGVKSNDHRVEINHRVQDHPIAIDPMVSLPRYVEPIQPARVEVPAQVSLQFDCRSKSSEQKIILDDHVGEPSVNVVQKQVIGEYPITLTTMTIKNPRRLARDKPKCDADFACPSIVDASSLNATSNNAIWKRSVQEAWRRDDSPLGVREGAWSDEWIFR